MIVKWKIFRDSFPYICTNCGEFSNSEKEFCEKCGKKDSLRKTAREDYDNHIEKVKAETTKSGITLKKAGIDLARKAKKIKTAKLILICFCAFVVIDIIGFLIIMNILGISIDQIGDHLWIFLGLVGFSLVMLIIIVVAIYFSYYAGKYLPPI
jgi:hypothetical protein